MSEPLTWVLGYAGGKVLDWLITHGLKSDLPARLRVALADWADKLPADIRIIPEALFPGVIDDSCRNNPAFEALRARLEKYLIPTAAEWAAVVRARRDAVIANLSQSKRHPFFNASDERVEPLFQELGKRLERVCRQDEQLFKGEVLALLKQIVENSRKPESIPEPPPTRDELLDRIMALIEVRQQLIKSLAALAPFNQQSFDESDPVKSLSQLRITALIKDAALKVLEFTQSIERHNKIDLMHSTWAVDMGSNAAKFVDNMVKNLKAHGYK